MRLDQYLVYVRHCQSRAKAQELITNGHVKLRWIDGRVQIPRKPSFFLDTSKDVKVELLSQQIQKYVSRAGLKLEGALLHTSHPIKGQRVFDIGQSTGGFTDCAVQHGASYVAGIDVGHGQLSKTLSGHKKIKSFEGVNAKSFFDSFPQANDFKEQFDLVLVDVSFISVTKILHTAHVALKSGAFLLALVKPQFELSKQSLNKKGVVKNPKAYLEVKNNTLDHLQDANFKILDYFKSSVLGTHGNQEYFVYAKKN